MIKIENVNKYFNKGKKNQIHVINNTTLEFGKSGLIALLGHSGSGKTTLLNAIGGLDKVNKGKIFINDQKITKRTSNKIDKIRNLNIGYIFQDYKLIDNITVFENIAITLRMIGIKDKKEITKRVNYVLESVNMYRYRNRIASMLSGGERQRVGIARAIVKNPNIIIADEPTGNLDSKNSLEIMNIIKAISKNKLVILVTHEVELAKFYASRIIEIVDGKVIRDYENTETKDLNYRLDNKIYLKDFEKIENINKNDINLDIYKENTDNLNLKIVVKNGNVYIESQDKKIEVIDENSNIELIDEHYKKIDTTIFEEYNYSLEELTNQNLKFKYSSINNIFKSIINGFKKIFKYSVLKKILLAGFFVSAMFIIYAISNIIGTLNVKDEDFISRNKSYLEVKLPQINVDDFIKYEKTDGINYIIPGNSIVSFKVKFDDYYQTSRIDGELSGSLSSTNMLEETNITNGRLPQNEYEIVIDNMVLERIIKFDNILAQAGLKNANQLLDKQVSIPNMKPFKIVGIVDLKSPCIYAYESNFINILSNTTISGNSLGIMLYEVSSEKNMGEIDNIINYKLKEDEIKLKQGKWPTEDYEVIVNITNKDIMKLNKKIKTKVNDKELKVVGYYDSVNSENGYLVNENTIKYKLISESQNLVIYPKNEAEVIQKFDKQYNLFIENTYKNDKQNYILEQKEAIRSAITFATIMLVISLVEIYLIIRSSFLSRIKEVGILRAIGVKKNDIYKMFTGEIIAITTSASMLGIIFMGYILNCISQVSYFSRMFTLNFKVILISIILIYVFNIIAGLLPLFTVLKKTPAQILARHDLE